MVRIKRVDSEITEENKVKIYVENLDMKKIRLRW